MAKNKKGPKKIPQKYGQNTKVSKKPKAPSSIQKGYDQHPVWQIGIIDLDGPFGWREIETEFLISEILPKVQDFETMKWSEILGRNNHEIPISAFSREAQRRLEKLGLDDLESMVSLRFTGAKRLWGIRIVNTIRVLWWDPDHKVCPSQLRHT